MSEYELLYPYSVTHDEESGNRCQKKKVKGKQKVALVLCY